MSSHAQPTPQQLQPLLETRKSTWKWLTGMITYHLVGIVALLAILAATLV